MGRGEAAAAGERPDVTRPRRVAIVGHTSIPHDPRVAKQASALEQAGYEVDVFGLRERGEAADERAGAVRLIRLPVSRRWHGFAGHMAEYAWFTGVAAVALAREHRSRHYGLVHVASPPDFLVAASLPLRAAGVPLVLDLHEDMPAFFAARFASPATRPLVPIVAAVARASAAAADCVVAMHEPHLELILGRGVPRDRTELVMNGADATLFDPTSHPPRAFMADGELRLIHHSSLQGHYGADLAVRAVSLLGELPARLDIYGDGPFRPELERTIDSLGLGDRVRVHGRVPLGELPALIAGADVGLVPTRPDRYAQLLLSTKLLEYAAMGKPVVATDLETYRAHLGPDAVRYVAGGEPGEIASAIREMAANPDAALQMGREARRQSAPYAWDVQARRYVALVNRLFAS